MYIIIREKSENELRDNIALVRFQKWPCSTLNFFSSKKGALLLNITYSHILDNGLLMGSDKLYIHGARFLFNLSSYYILKKEHSKKGSALYVHC
jgi:hypothetical protein